MCVYVSINKCLICSNTQSLLGDIPPLAGSQVYVQLSCSLIRAGQLGLTRDFPHQGHELHLVKRSLSSQELLEGAVLLLWGPYWLVWGHLWHPWMVTDSCCPLCKWGVQPGCSPPRALAMDFFLTPSSSPFLPSPTLIPQHTQQGRNEIRKDKSCQLSENNSSLFLFLSFFLPFSEGGRTLKSSYSHPLMEISWGSIWSRSQSSSLPHSPFYLAVVICTSLSNSHPRNCRKIKSAIH